MPHLTLHLSPNLAQEDWQDFFKQAHAILSAHADIAKCKSRVNLVSQVYLGENKQAEALAFLEVGLRPRPPEVLKQIGDQLFESLQAYLAPLLKRHALVADPTVEIRILEHYWQR
jgi:5-carboxymethyl-2-hydroxymuconate isomerase